MQLDSTTERRFWSKVNKAGPQQPHMDTCCWVWTGSTRGAGYGGLRVSGRMEGAHRVSYVLAYGAVPAGLVVAHQCDTPSCVRPGHLWVGTQADNVADRDSKGRQLALAGADNGNARLDAVRVQEIRSLHQQGHSMRALARRYGVDRGTVKQVVSRRTWKHI